jgi:hypothetical protein
VKPRGPMIYDRGLTPDLLDVALRIANSGQPWERQRQLLTIALRDRVSAQEAGGKTKKCLTRVWINPPDEARMMITWAISHAQLAVDRRPLHLGALLATFPFFASVAGIIGRALRLEGQVEGGDVRRRTRDVWGDKSSVDVGARKVYTTLRSFGVLEGGTRAPLMPGKCVGVPDALAPWMIHALMLSRRVNSVADTEIVSAPELFWAGPMSRVDVYPYLARHTEGRQRRVWVIEPGSRDNAG